ITILNSTIANNVSGGTGGGVRLLDAALSIVHGTIAGNSAANGGGIGNSGGTGKLRNNIVPRKVRRIVPPTPDFSGNLSSQGYNLTGNTTGTTITGTTIGNQLNVDPRLDTLKYNGAYAGTRTMAPLSGSPAIDTGHSSGYNVDQVGGLRPVDSLVYPNASGG